MGSRPYDFPCVSVMFSFQIANIIERSNRCRIVKFRAQRGFMIVGMESPYIEALECSISQQAAIASIEIANKSWLVHFGAVFKACVRCVEILLLRFGQ